MNFKYEWSNKKEGNYAIRKRAEKGKQAGKELEIKTKQTSDTHFFLLVENPATYETMWDIRKINEILKTIKYEYVYKGTKKVSMTKYLSQKDIEDVLQNIETYKNQTKRIETADSKLKQLKEKDRWNKMLKEIEKQFEDLLKDPKSKKETIANLLTENDFEKVLKLLGMNLEAGKDFKKKEKDAKIQIGFHNRAIQGIKDTLAEMETNIETEKDNREFNVHNLLFGKISKSLYNKFKEEKGYKLFIQILDNYYKLAKADKQRQRQNKIQEEYRERENAKNGKPKRKVGRPRKSEI